MLVQRYIPGTLLTYKVQYYPGVGTPDKVTVILEGNVVIPKRVNRLIITEKIVLALEKEYQVQDDPEYVARALERAVRDWDVALFPQVKKMLKRMKQNKPIPSLPVPQPVPFVVQPLPPAPLDLFPPQRTSLQKALSAQATYHPYSFKESITLTVLLLCSIPLWVYPPIPCGILFVCFLYALICDGKGFWLLRGRFPWKSDIDVAWKVHFKPSNAGRTLPEIEASIRRGQWILLFPIYFTLYFILVFKDALKLRKASNLLCQQRILLREYDLGINGIVAHYPYVCPLCATRIFPIGPTCPLCTAVLVPVPVPPPV